jgi:hypothetical protein
MILVNGATAIAGRPLMSQLRTGAIVRALTHNPESAGLPGDIGVVRGGISAKLAT